MANKNAYPNFAGRWGGRITPGVKIDPVVRGPEYQPTEPLKAKFTPHGGTARAEKKYTGDAMMGIAVRHKSGLEPVFSQQQAEDLARMRRG